MSRRDLLICPCCGSEDVRIPFGEVANCRSCGTVCTRDQAIEEGARVSEAEAMADGGQGYAERIENSGGGAA